MKNELAFTDKQLERLDEIYNTVYETLLVLLEKNGDELPWDMELVGNVTDAIAETCESLGHHVRYPSIVTNEDGSQTYEE